MNSQTILSAVCYCASTTTDELQNAKNALNKLYDMRKKCGFSFALYKAIKRQKNLIAHLQVTL